MFAGWFENAGELGAGLLVTLKVVLVASVITLVWASLVAWARLGRNRMLRWLAIAYIEIFRSTPILVQIFAIFTVLPAIGLKLPPLNPPLQRWC